MGVSIRHGTMSDVRALIRMHAECSPASVERRYLSPLPMLASRMAARLLCPTGGFSLVSEREGAMVAITTVAPYDEEPTTAEVGQLVADGCQRQGIGTAMLLAATREARRMGFLELVLTVHPDNRGVLPLVNSAGLRAKVSTRDGFTYVRIALPRASDVRPPPDAGGPATYPRLHSPRVSANN